MAWQLLSPGYCFPSAYFHFICEQSLTFRKVPEEKVPLVLDPLGALAKYPSFAPGLGPNFRRWTPRPCPRYWISLFPACLLNSLLSLSHFLGSITETPSQWLCILHQFDVLCSLERWYFTVFLSSYSRCPNECFLLPGRVRRLCINVEAWGTQLKTDSAALWYF